MEPDSGDSALHMEDEMGLVLHHHMVIIALHRAGYIRWCQRWSLDCDTESPLQYMLESYLQTLKG